MVKGLIDYNGGKIPFVIQNYEMTLFAEEDLVTKFSQEYNHQENYLLAGQYYAMGNVASGITLMVESSIGNTCYLKYFILYKFYTDEKPDAIRIESNALDGIFQYKHKYIDLARDGVNLSAELTNVYSIPFKMQDLSYQLCYSVGQDQRKGLADNFRMTGKIFVNLNMEDLSECVRIVTLLKRFAMFMTSNPDIDFSRITLMSSKRPIGFIYCKDVSEKTATGYDTLFYEFPVMKYVPKILDNLALELEDKITESIPLGHVENFESSYTPQRFLELINSFEYLFEKLEPQKSKDRRFTLQMELEFMFNSFLNILDYSQLDARELSSSIKSLRVDIVHGKAYYYNFKNNQNIKHSILLLADLVQRMSLKHIQFSDKEISEFRKNIPFF